jgi:preprotein translocase subunit SecG
MLGSILYILLIICAIMTIGIILMQRGRGGGLAGAFGAGGGSDSAFGTKAATLAQKVTIVLGVLLVVLSLGAGIYRSRQYAPRAGGVATPQPTQAPVENEPAL